MGIHIDETKCTGIGLCEAAAAHTFEVGDDGMARVVQDEPTGEELADAQRAVDECPTGALSID